MKLASSIIAIAIACISATGMAQAGELIGLATHVRDGDTIVVGKMPVRLNGLHAPEMNEEGGPAAKRAMDAMVLNKPLRCQLTGEISHDRVIGVCYRKVKDDWRDIAAEMVAAGFARDCPRYSNGRYAELETNRGKRLSLPKYVCRARPSNELYPISQRATSQSHSEFAAIPHGLQHRPFRACHQSAALHETAHHRHAA